MTMTAWSELEPLRSGSKNAKGELAPGERGLTVSSPTVAAACWDVIRSQPITERATVSPTGVDTPRV